MMRKIQQSHRSGIPLWVPAISEKHKNDDIYNQFNSKQEIPSKPKNRHPQGDATTNKQNVGWAKRAQPNITSAVDAYNDLQVGSCKTGPAHHLGLFDFASYLSDRRGPSYAFFDIIFKQSKLKSQWCECHQANLPKVLKTLQSNSVSYVFVTQQGYVNNKLRKRKVSQIYISNNLNSKDSL